MIEPSGPGGTALFISPHLDDVAFSCGGTVAALRGFGWRVALATVFTASVPRPAGFALACQLDKGLAADVDYMDLRRREDAAFARVVGIDDLHWLGLPEAPHRGYSSPRELFAGVRPGDAVTHDATAAIARIVRRLRPDLIFAPQAVGGHADHRQVVRAVLDLPATADRLAWYRDLPYAETRPTSPADLALPAGLAEVPATLGAGELETKLAGCECYTTQLPFQFGDVSAMRLRLAAFAAVEATRMGLSGHVETFLVSAAVATRLATAIRSPTPGFSSEPRRAVPV